MRRWIALVPALALCLSLTACWEAEAPDGEDFWAVEPVETPVVPTEPEKADAFTLPFLNGQTFDPIACSDGVQQIVGSLLYEGLFELDGQFEAKSVLCASYSRASNGLTYTFKLREGVAFSNGAALTAADVLSAYRRAQASERYAARFANVAAMRVNRGALVITLKQPDSALPALLDIPIVKSGTEKDTVPLGTGPYLYLTDSDGPCLVRNENWWQGGEVSPERIALTPAKDADAAAYLFSAERVHLLTADLLGESSASALGGVDIADAPTSTLLFLGFNVNRGALADASLRAAMGAAIDRAAIVETLLAGHARAAQFPIPPESPLYPAALETAFETGAYAAALDELYPAAADGSAAPVELTLLVNAENDFKAALAEHLARELSCGRVAVTPLVLPWADYLAALESGGFDLWLGEVRLTADWDVAFLVGSGGALNYGRYASVPLDTALKAFLKDENAATASALCELLKTETPILPIVFKNVSVLTPSGVIDGVAPAVSRPLDNLSEWTFHFPE